MREVISFGIAVAIAITLVSANIPSHSPERTYGMLSTAILLLLTSRSGASVLKRRPRRTRELSRMLCVIDPVSPAECGRLPQVHCQCGGQDGMEGWRRSYVRSWWKSWSQSLSCWWFISLRNSEYLISAIEQWRWLVGGVALNE